jgi:FixJ family two-component response regulator
MSGLELQRLLDNRRETPIVFVSSSTKIQSSVTAIKAGALEFLSKPFDRDALLRSLIELVTMASNLAQSAAAMNTYRTRYPPMLLILPAATVQAP